MQDQTESSSAQYVITSNWMSYSPKQRMWHEDNSQIGSSAPLLSSRNRLHLPNGILLAELGPWEQSTFCSIAEPDEVSAPLSVDLSRPKNWAISHLLRHCFSLLFLYLLIRHDQRVAYMGERQQPWQKLSCESVWRTENVLVNRDDV